MTVDGTKVTVAALEAGLLIETGIKHTFVVEGPSIRLVSVEAPTFVPGEEKTAVSYAIDGPVAQADVVQLKVWSAPPKGERVAVALVDIPGPYSANGKYEWDGTRLPRNLAADIIQSAAIDYYKRKTEAEPYQTFVTTDGLLLSSYAADQPPRRVRQAASLDDPLPVVTTAVAAFYASRSEDDSVTFEPL